MSMFDCLLVLTDNSQLNVEAVKFLKQNRNNKTENINTWLTGTKGISDNYLR
jgi:hypothetical protein